MRAIYYFYYRRAIHSLFLFVLGCGFLLPISPLFASPDAELIPKEIVDIERIMKDT